MKRRNNNVRRQYTAVHFMCCILFCVLTFLYLYFYQGDILALSQHILSGGATTYDKFIGAVVITSVLLIFHSFVYSILRLDRWFYWLTYLPSMLVLAILTDVTPAGDGSVFNPVWIWVSPIVLVVYAVTVRQLAEVDSLGKENSSFPLFSKVMWVNTLGITIMMLVAVGVSNTDVTFHNRIKMETSIIAGDYDAALSAGSDYTVTDSSLTMLRAYTLAVKGELPERLFEYSLTGGAASLRPNGKNVRSLIINNGDISKFIHSKKLGRRDVVTDYELCGELADCSLGRFEEHLRNFYQVDSLLPKHYKEALMMCSGVKEGDTLLYADTSMKDDYLDFVRLSRMSYKDHSARTELKNRYSKTYWYYYYCNRKD